MSLLLFEVDTIFCESLVNEDIEQGRFFRAGGGLKLFISLQPTAVKSFRPHR